MCIACGSKQKDVFQAKEWMFNTGKEFNFEFCQECQSIELIDPIVDSTKLYPEHYYSFSKNIEQLFATRAGQQLISRIKRQFNRQGCQIKEYRVLGLLRDFKLSYENRIADIGCGEGELLYLLRELGFSKTQGFDPFIEKSFRYSNGLEIKKMHVDEIKGPFDFIMLNHSFEHMKDPIGVLKKLRGLMDGDEARLMIRIPVVNMAWNLFREYWYQLDPPRHVHLYSPSGFSLLLNQVGLIVEKTFYDSTEAQILSSEKNFYRFNKKNFKFHIKRILKPFRKPRIRRTVSQWNAQGLGDQAAFLIRKKF